MSLFNCLGRTKVSVQVRGTCSCFLTKPVITVRNSQHLLAQPPNWRTTPCRLSANAYSIYSQLPSILEAIRPSSTLGRAVPWWQGPIYRGVLNTICEWNNEDESPWNLVVLGLASTRSRTQRVNFIIGVIYLNPICKDICHWTALEKELKVNRAVSINLLTPNVNYSWRTAPLTSKVAFYIFIQQI